MGACCYLINRNGMKKFLEQMANYDNDKKEYILKVNFLKTAKSEEFIFRYVITYFLMIPIVNIINLGSDIETSKHDAADYNMNNIANIHKSLSDKLYSLECHDTLLPIKYHLHWFSDKDELSVFNSLNY
jgi:hypothetical protein